MPNIDDIWGPLGEGWWRANGADCKASDQQIKFAAARAAGASRSKAAALAGYKGDSQTLRSAGSRVDDTDTVQNLMALAAAAAAGLTTVDPVTVTEAKAKVGKLVRSPDPTISLKASELFVKLEQAEKQAGTAPDDDGWSGDRFVRSLLLLPHGASMAMLLQAGTALSRMSLFHDMHFKLQQEPLGQTIWNALYERHSDAMKDDIARVLGDLSWQSDDRVRLWAEIGMKPIAPTVKDVVNV